MRFPRPARDVTLRVLVAIVGGVLGALAFPRVGIWPLAFASVAALSLAVDGCRSRRGAWLGLIYGLAFFLPLLHWTSVYVGVWPWFILVAGEAAFMAALGAVLPVLQRLHAAPLWVGAAWVLQELLRDRMPFGGFPWGRLAFSQAESPMRWFAVVGGAPLVTFAVAVIGALLGRALAPDREWLITRTSRLVNAGIAIALVFVGIVVGDGLGPADSGGEPHGLHIAMIQGNVPGKGLVSESRAREVLDYHVRETMKLVADVRAGRAAQPDLVLWPENASDVDPYRDPAAYQEIEATVKAVGAPILVGAITYTSDAPDSDRYNVGILWSPTAGPGSTYTKRHPVPFGEYMPLRAISERVSSQAKLVTNQMLAGTGNGLVTGGPVPFGDVICFEVAYDSLVRSSVSAGAQFLVVQTNNSTFGHTSETYQQLAMGQVRAVETGRTVLQVATTGESAWIGPDGKVQARSGPLFTADTINAVVEPRTAKTLAVRLGAWPEYVLGTLAVLSLLWALRGSLGRGWRTVRRRTGSPSRSQSGESAPEPEDDKGTMVTS
jgi:apolipoprotein N-acyltransferase